MAKTDMQRQIERATGVSRMQTRAPRAKNANNAARRKSRGGGGG